MAPERKPFPLERGPGTWRVASPGRKTVRNVESQTSSPGCAGQCPTASSPGECVRHGPLQCSLISPAPRGDTLPSPLPRRWEPPPSPDLPSQSPPDRDSSYTREAQPQPLRWIAGFLPSPSQPGVLLPFNSHPAATCRDWWAALAVLLVPGRLSGSVGRTKQAGVQGSGPL